MDWILFRKLGRMDWGLVLLMLIMCGISVSLIYSATYTSESEEFRLAYRSQMFWIPIGLVAFFVCALVDYRFTVRMALPIFGVIVVLLILVLLFGRKVHGARSWFGIGGFGIQPAEFAKLAYILLLGLLFQWRGEKVKNFVTFIGAIGLTIIPMGLILRQPDFGSASVFIPIVFMMMYVGGVKIRYLMIPVLLGLMGLALIVYYVQTDQSIPGLKEYQMNRIRTFFNPDLDRLNAGWTINQSLIAIGSGGLEGKGWLQGTQINLHYLPGNIGYTDFIFAVLGEEWGFKGGATMIVLQGLMLLGCVRIGMASGDALGSVLVAGVCGMLFTHAFVNIGMTIKVVPITGIPLPFISYGGTFLIVCMAALGIVQSVWIHRMPLERDI